MLSKTEIKESRKNIILCQATGVAPSLFLKNGFILNYIQKFGIADDGVILLLTFIPNLSILALRLFFALISDQRGIKVIGKLSIWMQLIGFCILPLIYFSPDNHYFLFFLSITVYSLGNAIFFSSWFSLIDPIIDPKGVGQFFAVIRTSCRIVGLILVFISSNLIALSDDKYMYALILLFITLLIAARLIYYSRIPELVERSDQVNDFFLPWKIIKNNKSYLRFCRYHFYVSFLTSSLIPFFYLFEKATLGFSDSQVIMTGIVNQVGAIVGFWVGAQIVDRKGSYYLFMISNLTYFIVVLSFIFVEFILLPSTLTIAILTFTMGLTVSAFRIGTTAEPLKQVKLEQKSFAIALSLMMEAAGGVLSSLVLSQYLKYWGGANFVVGNLSLNRYEVYLGAVALGLFWVNAFHFRKHQFRDAV